MEFTGAGRSGKRRSPRVRPPALEKADARYPGNDPKYRELGESELPLTESLKDTIARCIPYWHEVIAPTLKSGKHVIVSTHGNSLRALVKYLGNIGDDEIVNLNIPTGIPLVYEFDKQLKPLNHYYLGDAEEVKRAIKKVAG